MKRWTMSIAALMLPAAQLVAGMYYESQHVSEGPQGMQEFGIRGWAEGENAKVEFVQEAANGVICSGCYLLSEDAGATLYLINPVEETYTRWDLEAMLGAVGSVMESGLINVEFSTPESEELAREAGETLLGRETTHIRWRNRYEMQLKVMGFKQKNSIEVVQDFWVTEAPTDTGLGVWLRTDPPKTGNDGFDRMLQDAMTQVGGLPLKTKTVTTTVNKKGKSTVTTDTMEVTMLEVRDIDDATFTFPESYQEVQMLPGMGGAEEESPMEGLRGLLGRKKKN